MIVLLLYAVLFTLVGLFNRAGSEVLLHKERSSVNHAGHSSEMAEGLFFHQAMMDSCVAQ